MLIPLQQICVFLFPCGQWWHSSPTANGKCGQTPCASYTFIINFLDNENLVIKFSSNRYFSPFWTYFCQKGLLKKKNLSPNNKQWMKGWRDDFISAGECVFTQALGVDLYHIYGDKITIAKVFTPLPVWPIQDRLASHSCTQFMFVIDAVNLWPGPFDKSHGKAISPLAGKWRATRTATSNTSLSSTQDQKELASHTACIGTHFILSVSTWHSPLKTQHLLWLNRVI